MNPFAVVFWMLLACVGFLFSGTVTGAVAGLAIGITISIMVTLFSSR